ncbi:MAG TPA: hypothetical protein VFR40_08885 [Lapillicoccus sp.]|nr:hypothetical protein [Lapillicoccus sp.]
MDPQVPLTHVMLAREETPRLLARSLFRYWMTSRSYLIQLAVLAVLILGGALFFRSTLSLVVGVAVLLLTPVVLYLRCLRSARAFAPPGFTLGLGLGATHLALRHAVATTVTPYAGWRSVRRQGEAVILQTRRGGVLPMPVELVGPAFEQLQALVAAAASGPAPRVGPTDEPLPYAYECTSSTRGQLAWATTVRQFFTPGMIPLVALDLVVLAAPLLLRGLPWLWAVWPAALSLVLFLLAWWGAWHRVKATSSPGMVFRAGVRDDCLVLEDATGRATIAYRGVDRMFVMRHAAVIRSQLRSTVVFPRAVLPDAELRRAQGAVEWFRSRR